jgi:hypothetical protein
MRAPVGVDIEVQDDHDDCVQSADKRGCFGSRFSIGRNGRNRAYNTGKVRDVAFGEPGAYCLHLGVYFSDEVPVVYDRSEVAVGNGESPQTSIRRRVGEPSQTEPHLKSLDIVLGVVYCAAITPVLGAFCSEDHVAVEQNPHLGGVYHAHGVGVCAGGLHQVVVEEQALLDAAIIGPVRSAGRTVLAPFKCAHKWEIVSVYSSSG